METKKTRLQYIQNPNPDFDVINIERKRMGGECYLFSVPNRNNVLVLMIGAVVRVCRRWFPNLPDLRTFTKFLAVIRGCLSSSGNKRD